MMPWSSPGIKPAGSWVLTTTMPAAKAPTTTRVTELAGVTRGAQVHHFPTRADLVAAAVRHLAAKRTELAFDKIDAVRRSADPIDAALELREQGIHVALLIVDAGIEPFEGGGREGVDRAALADPREIADAVAFLANQGARAATHELQVTPLAERWVP